MAGSTRMNGDAKHEGENIVVASKVEETLLRASGRELQYPGEKLPLVEVDNFPLLGKVVAARFLEWVQHNPNGVISLPTGRTPEHFINWVKHFLDTWGLEETKKDLEGLGLEDTETRPNMKGLHFFQMDEFFPMDPSLANSFCSYVKHQYVEKFGLDPAKVRYMDTWTLGCKEGRNNGDVFGEGIDLTIMERSPKTLDEEEKVAGLHSVNQFCCDYEEEIRSLGGIGFFLGGVGPDGHIAFNCRGTDHNAITRLTKLNYESAAAAASDLGGIETARKKHVITIGLGTMKFNPNACITVFAAGDAKAKIISDAVQGSRNVITPASAFHDFPGFRFYLTKSAASRIDARIFEDFNKAIGQSSSVEDFSAHGPLRTPVETAIIDLALKCKTKLTDLEKDQIRDDRRLSFFLEHLSEASVEGAEDYLLSIAREIEKDLTDKIERSLNCIANSEFLHTAPHHDDIMLGYLPLADKLIREETNKHTFCYCTSGFNAVTNPLILECLDLAMEYTKRERIERMIADGAFHPSLPGDEDVDKYMNAHACRQPRVKDHALAQRITRCIAKAFSPSKEESCSVEWFRAKIHEAAQYYSKQQLGQKDSPQYQTFKGMLREFEADLLWGYHGFQPSASVVHLRMGFYKGELFTEEPQVRRDVLPLLNLMKEKQPKCVSVALDPEGSGPDTHYKVLQAVAAACKLYLEDSGTSTDFKVWGYRNVWFRFHPCEANLMFPVELREHAHLNDAFETCFVSQKTASFPTPEYDGNFSHFAQIVQAEQFENLQVLLGREYFRNHSSPRMRAARGIVFIHELSLAEFLERARALKYNAEG